MDQGQAGAYGRKRASHTSPLGFHAVSGFDAPVVATADVLVVGGGPAGVGAAIGAAQQGANVILAEHYPFLGGAHASGEIGTICGLYKTSGEDEDVPIFMGRGVARNLLHHLRTCTSGRRPQVATTGPQRWYQTYIEVYDPFWLRLCIDRMVLKAGVRTLVHATALDPIMSGDKVEGCLFATKAGIVAVKAKVVIDCTGDADLVARAGGDFRMAENGMVMHPTLLFRMFGVDTERLRYMSWDQIGEIMLRDGPAYGLNRFYPGVFLGCREGEVLINATKQTNPDDSHIDVLDIWQLNDAEFQGREHAAMYELFFREKMPGFEKARINVTACGIAVRETRLIEGEYRLTGEDVLSGRKFEDGIACSSWPMERMEGATVQLTWMPPGQHYEVPYRALIPKGLDGILAAGRCLSAEREAHASARTFALCMDEGEAVGVAAVMSIKAGKGVRDIDTQSLRRTMGGLLTQHSVS